MTDNEELRRERKKAILKHFEKTPLVRPVCQKVGITTMTYYRWIKNDPKFGEMAEEILKNSREDFNDIAESALMQAVINKEPWAIRFWLLYNSKQYRRRKEISIDREGITDINVRITKAPKRGDSS